MRSKSAELQWLFQYSTQTRLHFSSSFHLYYVKTHAKNGIFFFFYKSDNKWKHGGGSGWHTRHNTRGESVSTLLHSVSLLISIISAYANLLWVTFQRKVSTLTTEREPDSVGHTTDTVHSFHPASDRLQVSNQHKLSLSQLFTKQNYNSDHQAFVVLSDCRW